VERILADIFVLFAASLMIRIVDSSIVTNVDSAGTTEEIVTTIHGLC